MESMSSAEVTDESMLAVKDALAKLQCRDQVEVEGRIQVEVEGRIQVLVPMNKSRNENSYAELSEHTAEIMRRTHLSANTKPRRSASGTSALPGPSVRVPGNEHLLAEEEVDVKPYLLSGHVLMSPWKY